MIFIPPLNALMIMFNASSNPTIHITVDSQKVTFFKDNKYLMVYYIMDSVCTLTLVVM